MARLRLRAISVLGIAVWARGSRVLQRRPWRSLPAGRTLQAGAVLTGLALLGASVPASAQALTWSVVPSPSPGTSTFLYGVSCASAGTCTAVGFKDGTTLVESWNGTSWSVVPSPSPGSGGNSGACPVPQRLRARPRATTTTAATIPRPLSSRGTAPAGRWCPAPAQGLAATASGRVLRLGGRLHGRRQQMDSTDLLSKTLIESWNGTRWSVVPSPNRGSDGDPFGRVLRLAGRLHGRRAPKALVSTLFPGPSSSPGTAPAGRWCPAPAQGPGMASGACPVSRRPRAQPSASTPSVERS